MPRSSMPLTAATLFLAIAACNPISDQANNGTTRGYQECLDRGKTQSLHISTVKAYCIKLHQQRIFIDLNGRAGWDATWEPAGKSAYKGYVVNKTEDYVITSFQINLIRADRDNDQNKSFTEQWIEPGSVGEFRIGSDEIYTQPADDATKKDGIWNVEKIYGIKIKI